ncbi:hypothetical protein BpHYR1_017602 [Brachionus plicatilis]|uniref:Uncharacterized protein n=1 Tax=Brachionus plicatilis TaxID=10195 RepID=A0A3M7T971_BRAPC|nr:hypothetical protein BpHYR1_017602 [Brachionus plicatilis]
MHGLMTLSHSRAYISNKSGYRKKWRLVESLNCIEIRFLSVKLEILSRPGADLSFVFWIALFSSEKDVVKV